MTPLQILGLSYLAIYPVLFGMRDGVTYATNSRKYHKLGFIERLATAVLALQGFLNGIIPTLEFFLWLFASGVWFWVVFDLVWNWSAHQPLFYVGHTAYLDVRFGKKIYAAKAMLLILAATMLIIYYKL